MENRHVLEAKITNWLNHIAKESILPEKCNAIYIGLIEGQKNYMIHFLGSVEFDKEDDDWACEGINDYIPNKRYLDSGITIQEAWEEFQNEVVSIIKELKSNNNPILSQTSNIAVGFDSGDLEYI